MGVQYICKNLKRREAVRAHLGLNGIDYLTRELLAMAAELCDGKIVFVLEGGYNLISLTHGALNVAYAALGDSQLIDPLGPAKGKDTDVTDLVNQVKRLHRL